MEWEAQSPEFVFSGPDKAPRAEGSGQPRWGRAGFHLCAQWREGLRTAAGGARPLMCPSPPLDVGPQPPPVPRLRNSARPLPPVPFLAGPQPVSAWAAGCFPAPPTSPRWERGAGRAASRGPPSPCRPGRPRGGGGLLPCWPQRHPVGSPLCLGNASPRFLPYSSPEPQVQASSGDAGSPGAAGSAVGGLSAPGERRSAPLHLLGNRASNGELGAEGSAWGTRYRELPCVCPGRAVTLAPSDGGRVTPSPRGGQRTWIPWLTCRGCVD